MKTKKYLNWFPGVLFVMVFLMTPGCVKNENKQSLASEIITIGKPATCYLLTKYTVSNNLSFSIDSISDYRCPLDVECIWSGDVDLLFSIDQNAIHTDTLIHTITRRNNPFTFGGYTWEVLKVNPLPYSHQIIHPEDYQIEILIQKN